MTDVDACESAAIEAFRVNGVAPGTIARTTRALGAHLVHVSTDYIFDGESGPYTEDAVPNPRGVYALTKHIGEQAVRALSDSWAIARTAVVYGWPPAGTITSHQRVFACSSVASGRSQTSTSAGSSMVAGR